MAPFPAGWAAVALPSTAVWILLIGALLLLGHTRSAQGVSVRQHKVQRATTGMPPSKVRPRSLADLVSAAHELTRRSRVFADAVAPHAAWKPLAHQSAKFSFCDGVNECSLGSFADYLVSTAADVKSIQHNMRSSCVSVQMQLLASDPGFLDDATLDVEDAVRWKRFSAAQLAEIHRKCLISDSTEHAIAHRRNGSRFHDPLILPTLEPLTPAISREPIGSLASGGALSHHNATEVVAPSNDATLSPIESVGTNPTTISTLDGSKFTIVEQDAPATASSAAPIPLESAVEPDVTPAPELALPGGTVGAGTGSASASTGAAPIAEATRAPTEATSTGGATGASEAGPSTSMAATGSSVDAGNIGNSVTGATGASR